MGKFFILSCLVLFGIGNAAEVDINGQFEAKEGAALPEKWQNHATPYFKPYPKTEVKKDPETGKNILRIFDTSKNGGAIYSNKIPAKSGDTLMISFKSRGKNYLMISLHFYTDKGEWNPYTGTPFKPNLLKLNEKWDEHSLELPVVDGTAGPTETVCLAFFVRHGGDAEITDLKVECISGNIRGNVSMPEKWKVFLPVARDFVPEKKDLLSIPEKFGGVAGRIVAGKKTEIDLLPLFGKQKPFQCAWLFAEKEVPYDCEFTLGAGGDWYMTWFLNGEKIIDTSETGGVFPFSITNELKTVRLRKGRNIFAVKYVTGNHQSKLLVGSPSDLRLEGMILKSGDVIVSDDFEQQKNRIGNPELIRAHSIPGILIDSTQGVYITDREIPVFEKHSFSMAKRNACENGEYRVLGLRLQSFGRKQRSDSELIFRFARKTGQGEGKIVFRTLKTSPWINVTIVDDGKEIRLERIPYQHLPADILCGFNGKRYYVLVKSLSSSRSYIFTDDAGCFLGMGQKKNSITDEDTIQAEIVFKSLSGETAELVIDDYSAGYATLAGVNKQNIPFKIDIQNTFDPVQSGWKMVFNDEFDGPDLDLNKWRVTDTGLDNYKNASEFKDGKLIIRAEPTQDGRLETFCLLSRSMFRYGYFETRVKFSREPGWWGAFWINAPGMGNTFLSGAEIDIFEDYFTRKKMPDGKNLMMLDYNLHAVNSGNYKGWNYNSTLPGVIDDFYVIGCKWTPFEISYYLNGKIIRSNASHSPYNSVTFDAFHHVFTPMPNPFRIGGCNSYKKIDDLNPKPKLPDTFTIDYVRVYADPNAEKGPVLKWTSTPKNAIVGPGENFSFAADVHPSPTTESKVRTIYFFDSGFMLDYKKELPARFDWAIDSQHYKNSLYCAPGRSGDPLSPEGKIHVFMIAAQDELGNVGTTDPFLVIQQNPGSRPYGGKTQSIPGNLILGRYDEGPAGTAYFDNTPQNTYKTGWRPKEGVDCDEKTIVHIYLGEWIKYTVNIAKAGRYKATLTYVTPVYRIRDHKVVLFLDKNKLGEFAFQPSGKDWGAIARQSIEVELPAGEHGLTLLMEGVFNLYGLNFTEIK
ncbi:MAG: Glucan endo-1,3-beta-glucosidase A1 precursor [Lentisphaerae bacterium ADurb.Bin242]|nr:MAG: Glucan endo-1,3-beta-glucosidase A1 precursor [Lentisphaerae bacterium ADurb.Bin242]